MQKLDINCLQLTRWPGDGRQTLGLYMIYKPGRCLLAGNILQHAMVYPRGSTPQTRAKYHRWESECPRRNSVHL